MQNGLEPRRLNYVVLLAMAILAVLLSMATARSAEPGPDGVVAARISP